MRNASGTDRAAGSGRPRRPRRRARSSPPGAVVGREDRSCHRQREAEVDERGGALPVRRSEDEPLVLARVEVISNRATVGRFTATDVLFPVPEEATRFRHFLGSPAGRLGARTRTRPSPRTRRHARAWSDVPVSASVQPLRGRGALVLASAATSLRDGLMTRIPWSPSTRATSPSEAHRKRPSTPTIAGMSRSLRRVRVLGPLARSLRTMPTGWARAEMRRSKTES